MKSILIALTLVATIAWNQAGFAQTASPADAATAPPIGATPANDAAQPAPAPDAATVAEAAAPAADQAATPAPAPDTATVAEAADPAAGTPAAEASAPADAPVAATDAASPDAALGEVAADDAAQPTDAPATADATNASPTATPDSETSNAPTAEEAPVAATDAAMPAEASRRGTIIPLIVMDDVPLTDAIRNLCRQAGINFVLDPKIPYGQVGPDGKVMPQPSVTIRWENITAEQALNALLSNYSLQLVEDPKSKIARITVKDPAAPDPLVTKIYQLKYASPSNVMAAVTATLDPKRSKAMPDVRTSQLVVLATEKEMVTVDELIESLDLQTRQVLIETRLLEVRNNPATKKGIDWTGTALDQRVTFGNGFMTGESTTTIPGETTTSTTTLPGGRQVTTTSKDSYSTRTILDSIIGGGGFSLNTASGITPNIGFLNADGVSATLSFLNTYTESKVLSAPRTVTLDNEEARIEVGTLYPVVNTTAGTANTTGGSQITYSNLTVNLRVTPRISANDYVNLKVSPSISRLGPKVASVVGGVENEVDSFLTRQLDTRVMIPSGNTLVMGGLIQDEINSGNTKVPILGDIPILGYLFRVDSKQRDKGNLVVFITPTIVQDEDFQPTKTDFLKTRLPEKDELEGDWSYWDSGKPRDWSKKKAVPQEPAYDQNVGASPSASKKVEPQEPVLDESLNASPLVSETAVPQEPVLDESLNASASASTTAVPQQPVLDTSLNASPSASKKAVPQEPVFDESLDASPSANSQANQ